MGEEANSDDFDGLVTGYGSGDDSRHGDDGGRVMEWEIGLPSADELTPLSQPLVPPDLASAFSISPEPGRTILDVHRASESTLSSLRRHQNPSPSPSPSPNPNPTPFPEDPNPVQPDNQEAAKRPRLVWTPQLHKRFVDVVGHIGINNAVPKTIMQLMNVEGLTRENVASHLQKYRLYLKRMQGFSNEGPSTSDQLFASTPVPPSLQDGGSAPPQPVPMPYTVPTMVPMPVYHGGNNGHIGMVPMNNSYQHYGGFANHRGRDWPTGGSKFGSGFSYPSRVSPRDN